MQVVKPQAEQCLCCSLKGTACNCEHSLYHPQHVCLLTFFLARRLKHLPPHKRIYIVNKCFTFTLYTLLIFIFLLFNFFGLKLNRDKPFSMPFSYHCYSPAEVMCGCRLSHHTCRHITLYLTSDDEEFELPHKHKAQLRFLCSLVWGYSLHLILNHIIASLNTLRGLAGYKWRQVILIEAEHLHLCSPHI